MKIAIDKGPLSSGHKVRGVGWYTSELIKSLGSKVETADFGNEDLSKFDIVHYPYFSLTEQTLPLVKKNKIVVTIHDLIPLIYPRHYPFGIKGKINFFFQKLALKNADAVITVSETSKKDIIRFLNVDPFKIHVIYHGSREIFKKILNNNLLNKVKKKYSLPDKFVLYVGDINYNKNIPNLIRAAEISGLPLVICGKQALEIEKLDLSHPELIHLKPIMEKLKNTIRLGFVPDEDLVAIYNLATIYCQPSFYEGFGLPLLESFACETPVVASRTQCLVEIGENACAWANSKDPQDLANKITQLIKNPKIRLDLIEKGKKRLENFSWKKAGNETLKVYESI